MDREGLGADFLAQLKDDYQMITLLRSNQYRDLSSFTDVGQFVPLCHNKQGQVVCEVAPARFTLARSEPAADPLLLYVALIRDWRRLVPVESNKKENENSLPRDGWWEEDWEPTPLPASLTTPKLIPLVSTAPLKDVVDCVQRYQRRWPAQENIIRDFLLPLGLDHNHGYRKQRLENSEISKRRQALQQQLDNVLRWRKQACQRGDRAGRLYYRRYDQAKARSEALSRNLNADRIELGFFDLPPHLVQRYLNAKKEDIDAQLEQLWQGVQRAYDNSYQQDRKVQRYAFKACNQFGPQKTASISMWGIDRILDKFRLNVDFPLPLVPTTFILNISVSPQSPMTLFCCWKGILAT